MKTLALTALAASATLGLAAASEPPAEVTEAKGLVKEFFTGLNGKLQAGRSVQSRSAAHKPRPSPATWLKTPTGR